MLDDRSRLHPIERRDRASPDSTLPTLTWAHSQRKFFELADIAASKRRGGNASPISPLALEAVKRIDLLFDIERGIVGKSATERFAAHHELSAPALADLKDWMRAERGKLSRHAYCSLDTLDGSPPVAYC